MQALLTFAVLLLSQFEKEDQIHSIDIGNEGSAFIEVLVGNSSAVRDQDYEVWQIIPSTKYSTSSYLPQLSVTQYFSFFS